VSRRAILPTWTYLFHRSSVQKCRQSPVHKVLHTIKWVLINSVIAIPLDHRLACIDPLLLGRHPGRQGRWWKRSLAWCRLVVRILSLFDHTVGRHSRVASFQSLSTHVSGIALIRQYWDVCGISALRLRRVHCHRRWLADDLWCQTIAGGCKWSIAFSVMRNGIYCASTVSRVAC
jgi:hypothetical protein